MNLKFRTFPVETYVDNITYIEKYVRSLTLMLYVIYYIRYLYIYTHVCILIAVFFIWKL